MFGEAEVAALAADLVGADASVAREGAGWDHVAWRVQRGHGPAWIVRAPTAGDPTQLAADVRREVAVMQLTRGRLGDLVADARVLDESVGCLAHPRVAGIPLQDLLVRGAIPVDELRRLAVGAGRVIATIGAIEPAGSAEPIPVDDDGLDVWLAGVGTHVAAIGDLLDPATRAAVDRFVATAPPPAPSREQLVLAHNDLGAEHVLVDPATFAVTGIIDWSDAAVTDPAADVGRLLRDLGELHLEDVLAGLDPPAAERPALTARAWCYARLLAVEDLAHAAEHRPDLVAFELASVRRLYAGL